MPLKYSIVSVAAIENGKITCGKMFLFFTRLIPRLEVKIKAQ